MPENGVGCESFTIISVDSLLVYKNKYYLVKILDNEMISKWLIISMKIFFRLVKISFLILINGSWINVVLDRINLSEGIENKSIKDKRIKEHLKTDKKSHIYQHFSTNINCFSSSTDDCLSILDYASTMYPFKIKRAFFISWIDSVLNKQKKTLKITLCV